MVDPHFDIQKELDKYKEYHFSAYKNLVITLVGTNSAGIAASLAFMSLISSDRCKSTTEVISSCNVLEISLIWFIMGLLGVLIEIYIEYFSYFRYKKIIGDENRLERSKLIFARIQIPLLIASGICLLVGGFFFIKI